MYKYIVLTGNLKDGFISYGPFESIYTTTSDEDGVLIEDVASELDIWMRPKYQNSVHVVPLHVTKNDDDCHPIEQIKHHITEQKRLKVYG